MQNRCVAIITGADTYLDHLGVLAYFMDIPLLVTERETYAIAKEFYPQINVVLIEMADLSVDFLAENFDVIFETGKCWSAELGAAFQSFWKKKPTCVYCPHGNSDKGHSAKNHMTQDVSLVYGDHMIDLLTRTGGITKIGEVRRTGNYREPFYEQYKKFYRDLMYKKIGGALDPAKKVILYAPTWVDGENPSSFFAKTKIILEQLAPEWNLVIKLHPFLAEYHPAQTYRTIGLYESIPGVVFLEKFPAIYPLLDLADLYLGDYSSIGYDFLFFDKPLYFFAGDEEVSKASLLHSCGFLVPESELIDLFIRSTIEENRETKRQQRASVYKYAFGEKKSFIAMQEQMRQILRPT